MANSVIFASANAVLPATDTVNEAGGQAYSLPAKHALAQLAATGCFNGTFYATATDQLASVISLAAQVDDLFLAKLAVYSRERAMMKDMPAALLLILSKRSPTLGRLIFTRIVDNGRILRTCFQMLRSGQFGRKSLSSALQKSFQAWLNDASVGQLLSASIGDKPSLRDVLRSARPTPADEHRSAFFRWLVGKEIGVERLPRQVQSLIAYRSAESAAQQVEILASLDARWDLLADSAKDSTVWTAIARKMGHQALRMNLNTLVRHEVFADEAMVEYVAGKLSNAEEVAKAKQFPYQYMAAYLNSDDGVPQRIKSALHKAAELACGNIPSCGGPVLIGLDTSGSMGSAVTGNRGSGATSKMRCVDVAAVFAAAMLRRNPDSRLVPFDTSAYQADFDPEDTILSLSKRLAQYGGGGTNCALPLAVANGHWADKRFVGCILVSDNESWVRHHSANHFSSHYSTGVMQEWATFKRRLPQAKLVCIDIQPYASTQAPERADILNVGGFSDAVFTVTAGFLASDSSRFVAEIEAENLDRIADAVLD